MLRINENDRGYYVELHKFDSTDFTRQNRLGYYCDREHLKHMVLEIFKVFTIQDLVDILLRR